MIKKGCVSCAWQDGECHGEAADWTQHESTSHPFRRNRQPHPAIFAG
jgi:hypothetical protein